MSPNSEVWTDSKEEMFFTSSEIQELRQTNHGKHLDHDVTAPFMGSQSEQEQEWCDRSSTGSDEIFFVFGKPLINKRHSLFDECQAAAGEWVLLLVNYEFSNYVSRALCIIILFGTPVLLVWPSLRLGLVLLSIHFCRMLS